MILDVEFIENSKELTADFSENEQHINAELDSVIVAGGDPEASYNSGYEAGQKSAYDAFWDEYQQNGTRTDYRASFGAAWTNKTFKPKYDIKPKISAFMFYSSGIKGSLKTLLENAGVTMKFECSGNSLTGVFQFAQGITEVPVIDCMGATSTQQTFYQCYALETIEEIKVYKENVIANNMFTECNNLKNVNFTGVIASNGLNLLWSTKLTIESLRSIINCLEDKSADTSGTNWLVTVGSANLAKLTEEDKNNIEKKGWTFA